MDRRLLIPGPVQVHADVLKAQTRPMIGHRSKEYEALHERVVRKLRQALGWQSGHVLLLASSGTGGMEGGVRNLVSKKILHVTCGAFGERWVEVSKSNGKETVHLSAPWGKGNRAEEIRRELSKGGFDAVAVTHSETSTGVLNRLEEIGGMLREFPDVLFLVDAVSSMAGVPIDVEGWGIDWIFAGTQKAWGLPPGLAVVWMSDRALARAQAVPNRGYYFDAVKMVEMGRKNQTPETPAISLIHALDYQLDRMLQGGMENRYRRNAENARRIRDWGRERGFPPFPEEGFEGVTLSCLSNGRGIDLGRFIAGLKERGFEISDGYGRLKGRTFRIAHMGDITWEDDLGPLLEAADSLLARM